MKAYIISIFVILTIIGTGTALISPQMVEECKTESGLTDMKKDASPDDPKYKCFFTCIFKKTGKITDGKLSADKFIAFIEKSHKKLPEIAKILIKHCCDEANKKDGCDIVSEFIKCIKEKGGSGGGSQVPTDE